MRQTPFQQGSPDDYMALTDEVLMLREKVLRVSEFQAWPSPEFTCCQRALAGLQQTFDSIFELEKMKTTKEQGAA